MVCYHAVWRAGLGLVIPLLEQGWVCYPAAVRLALIAIVWVETGLGLLSRCQSRAGFVIPLLEQGWVCYPAAVRWL